MLMRTDLQQAIELMRSSGTEQLDRVLQLIHNTVFSFSMRVCGHREDAEDTAQEVLVKAVPYLPRFENAQALASWLYTVARNRCLMSRRRSKFAPHQHLSLDELRPDAFDLERLLVDRRSPERSVLLTEDKERLQQAILQVPPQYRLVLVLHDIEELSAAEVSKVLGITPGNVRVRLHRARLFVRRELARPYTGKKPDGMPAYPSQCTSRCKRVFSNLSNYMDGLLDGSLCQELENHMQGCEPCQAFLAELKQTVAGIRDLPSLQPDPLAASRARARALASTPPTR